MRTINIKRKVHLLSSILFALFVFQGTQNAQNNSDNKENAYNRVAKDLTAKLSKQVNLTEDQVGKVQDVLVDYQQDIADKFDKGSAAADNNRSKNDLSEQFRDLDKETNDKIEKSLSENERSSYLDVKKDWWVKIKDKVYSREFFEMVSNREDEESGNVATTDRDRNVKNENDNARNENVGDRGGKTDNDNVVNTAGTNELDARFEPFAKQMATELMQKINLSLQQAADVQDALVDYQKSIADLRSRNMTDDTDSEIGGANNNRRRDAADNRPENIVGRDRENEMPDLSDADESAVNNLEDVLTDDQKTRYERVKNQWWKEVKNRIVANVRKESREVENK